MAVTMQQVREVLDPEEPNYQRGVALGPEALPHLEALVTSGDPMLASKATYLASLIQDARSTDVVEKAARSPHAIVRVAAAAAAPNLAAPEESDVLRALHQDPDPGVRKVAQAKGRKRQAQPGAAPKPAPAAGPETTGERIVFGLMPGETESGAGAPRADQPGSSSMTGGGGGGMMPGERGQNSHGTMPSESRSASNKGEMPK